MVIYLSGYLSRLVSKVSNRKRLVLTHLVNDFAGKSVLSFLQFMVKRGDSL